MNAALEFNNLTIGYDRHPAVHHLEGKVEKGALLAIIGPNGAGKSTLLKSIMGTLLPLSGKIDYCGQKRKNIAYLPQLAELDLKFPISVYDLIAMGCWRKSGLFGGLNAALKHKIADAIHTVGLNGFESRPIGTLSGGQMQRALFARLLLQDASLILLDEPFAAIDTKTVDDLIRLIRHWQSEGRTVLAVLHDMAIVAQHFPQTLLLAREMIAWGKTQDVLQPQNMLRARQMVEAFDSHAPVCEQAA